MQKLKIEECVNLRGKYVCSVSLVHPEHVVVGFGDSRDEALEELENHFASHMSALGLDKNDYELIKDKKHGSECD